MKQPSPKSTIVACLPVQDLTEGDICPPLDPEHPSWDVIAPWDDPLASRGGYRGGALKQRVTVDGQPAIAWSAGNRNDRSFITGHSTWRELSLQCRVQALQAECAPTYDEPFGARTRAGLVFRMETVRHYYTFCLEAQKRLILYRRSDDEWTELDAREVGLQNGILTLRVTLSGDAIHAECPELNYDALVTDSRYHSGLAGFRALGVCHLFALDIAMTPGQKAVNERLSQAWAAQASCLSGAIPDEEPVTCMDLGGGKELAACTDFHEAGHNDLLFTAPEGMTAQTWDGKRLWTFPETLENLLFSADRVKGGRILFGMTGKRGTGNEGYAVSVTGKPLNRGINDELVALDGATGRLLRRIKLPVSPREDLVHQYDLSYETGRLSGAQSTDFLVREWRSDWGGGGETLWAFDRDLNLLWQRTVHPGYGHHNAVHCFDVDGDGRDEILAGGNLLSAAGEPIWRHDRADTFFTTMGGQHYDAALIGRYADDPELDPCAFLIGGSAGVYVVDALTGRTRAHYAIGHAQWALPCKVRDDIPGTQVMVGTRWDNYGILTLFSGRGERLWSIQPDYLLQGTCPVQWTPSGPQHIWFNQSLQAMGLYDGFGRCVKPLDKIRKLYRFGTKKPVQVLRRTPESPDWIGLQIADTLHVFGATPG